MPSVLNNVATANAYTTGNTLESPRGVRVDINCSNASIYYQIGLNVNVHKQDPNTIRELLGGDIGQVVGDIVYGNEVFFPPRQSTLSRICDSIRIRSAVAGKPAQVTLAVWRSGEILGF